MNTVEVAKWAGKLLDKIEERLAGIKLIGTSVRVMGLLCYSSNCYVNFVTSYHLDLSDPYAVMGGI